ncbi:MAG: hypothetical protein LC808_03470 [Actinobacteria bacterium]|nr:hypothetical protein [Actinomycetota bacterium]
MLTAAGVPATVFVDAWAQVRTSDPGNTWSNANRHARAAGRPDRRIDYVLVAMAGESPESVVVRADLEATTAQAGVQPSDHFAVVVELAVPGSPTQG